ncbi:hypothetical protein HMPREF0168_2243 [Bifidobacterium dentium ATCC 27679]|uniref:Uncharacterized protein n=1 Tax=Bifidobacterium dentium ATCC 27679 TaxID=871562 RepID=E0QAT5_9BIFI|nr:hypothetical protein HMPREF0168_2243 [Bifidobacterium dentium ATCC 27679]
MPRVPIRPQAIERQRRGHGPPPVHARPDRRARHHVREGRRPSHHRLPPRIERIPRLHRRHGTRQKGIPPRDHRLPGHAEQGRATLTAGMQHVRHQTEPRLAAVRTGRMGERRVPRHARGRQAPRRDPRRDARQRRRARPVRQRHRTGRRVRREAGRHAVRVAPQRLHRHPCGPVRHPRTRILPRTHRPPADRGQTAQLRHRHAEQFAVQAQIRLRPRPRQTIHRFGHAEPPHERPCETGKAMPSLRAPRPPPPPADRTTETPKALPIS